jgi:hypothetical protein
MSYSSTPPRTYQIDVVDHVGRAYRVVFDNLQLAVEMALLPYLIVLAAELVVLLIPGMGFFSRILAALLQAIGFFVFSTVFIVRWHRFVLLDESVSGGLIPPGWSTFLITGIKLGAILLAAWIVLMLIAFLPPSFLMVPLSVIGGFAMALLSLRVSMIFPAAAIERPIGMQTAWNWVAGNYWRLFACTFACYLPFVVMQMLIGGLASVFPSLTWIIFEALRLAVSFAGVAVVATLFSHLYREFGGMGELA